MLQNLAALSFASFLHSADHFYFIITVISDSTELSFKLSFELSFKLETWKEFAEEWLALKAVREMVKELFVSSQSTFAWFKRYFLPP